MINGNEDCLAKCEWPASEDIDGRMDGWTGGSVWTDRTGIASDTAAALRLHEIRMYSTCSEIFFYPFSVSSETG